MSAFRTVYSKQLAYFTNLLKPGGRGCVCVGWGRGGGGARGARAPHGPAPRPPPAPARPHNGTAPVACRVHALLPLSRGGLTSLSPPYRTPSAQVLPQLSKAPPSRTHTQNPAFPIFVQCSHLLLIKPVLPSLEFKLPLSLQKGLGFSSVPFCSCSRLCLFLAAVGSPSHFQTVSKTKRAPLTPPRLYSFQADFHNSCLCLAPLAPPK
jgi:hypothetical protein